MRSLFPPEKKSGTPGRKQSSQSVAARHCAEPVRAAVTSSLGPRLHGDDRTCPCPSQPSSGQLHIPGDLLRRCPTICSRNAQILHKPGDLLHKVPPLLQYWPPSTAHSRGPFQKVSPYLQSQLHPSAIHSARSYANCEKVRSADQ